MTIGGGQQVRKWTRCEKCQHLAVNRCVNNFFQVDTVLPGRCHLFFSLSLSFIFNDVLFNYFQFSFSFLVIIGIENDGQSFFGGGTFD
jgi:hypothetical protein